MKEFQQGAKYKSKNFKFKNAKGKNLNYSFNKYSRQVDAASNKQNINYSLTPKFTSSMNMKDQGRIKINQQMAKHRFS